MTGQPYALWAHVRFVGKDGTTTGWSAPFGFNMRWRDRDVPSAQTAPLGLVRWTPVEGATALRGAGYTDPSPRRLLHDDERRRRARVLTFHQAPLDATIHWRVRARALRRPRRSAAERACPRVSYGPWSPVQTTVEPAGPLLVRAARADAGGLGRRRRPAAAAPRARAHARLRVERHAPTWRGTASAASSTASTSRPTRAASTRSSPAPSSAARRTRRASTAARWRCRRRRRDLTRGRAAASSSAAPRATRSTSPARRSSRTRTRRSRSAAPLRARPPRR